MAPHRRLRSKLPAALAVIGLLLALSGCPLSPDKEEDKPPEETRLTERNTVEGAIARLADVWHAKDYTEYEALLHDEFKFYLLDKDANDFTWLTTDYWGRTEELQFASNMFDPNFSGTNPPVDSIDWTYNILSQRNTTDGSGRPVTEVTTDAVITVLTGPNDGFSSDTRFVFLVTKDPQFPDLFQILEQREIEKL